MNISTMYDYILQSPESFKNWLDQNADFLNDSKQFSNWLNQKISSFLHRTTMDASILCEFLMRNCKVRHSKDTLNSLELLRFTSLKELLIKKREKKGQNKELYFDDVTNKDYIPSIIHLGRFVKRNGLIQINTNVSINLISNEDNPELKEALWIVNKIRDSINHGKCFIQNDCLIVINDKTNDTSLKSNEKYKIVCSIPLSELRLFTFYVSNHLNPETIEEEELKRLYIKYYSKLMLKFMFSSSMFKNYFYKEVYNYQNELIKIINKTKDSNIESTRLIINNKYNDYKYNDNKYNDTCNIDRPMKISSEIRPTKMVDYPIPHKELSRDYYIKLLEFYIEYLSHDSNIENNIKIELLKALKAKIIDNNCDVKEEDVLKSIKEISDILGLSCESTKEEKIIALYNYMRLAFSNEYRTIDYRYIRTKGLSFEFPSIIGEKGTESNKFILMTESITKLITDFIAYMQLKLEKTDIRDGEIIALEQQYNKFMEKLQIKVFEMNKEIVTSIRNGIEHKGIDYVEKNIVLKDQSNQTDDSTIKVKITGKIFSMKSFTDRIVRNKNKEYDNRDLYNQLSKYVGNDLVQQLAKVIKNYQEIPERKKRVKELTTVLKKIVIIKKDEEEDPNPKQGV